MDLSDLSMGRFMGFTGIGWVFAREGNQTSRATRGKHLNVIRGKWRRAIRVAANGVGGNLVGAF